MGNRPKNYSSVSTERFNQWMKLANLTQKQISEAARLSPQTVNSVSRGKTSLTIFVADAVQNACTTPVEKGGLGLPPHLCVLAKWLLNKTDAMTALEQNAKEQAQDCLDFVEVEKAYFRLCAERAGLEFHRIKSGEDWQDYSLVFSKLGSSEPLGIIKEDITKGDTLGNLILSIRLQAELAIKTFALQHQTFSQDERKLIEDKPNGKTLFQRKSAALPNLKYLGLQYDELLERDEDLKLLRAQREEET